MSYFCPASFISCLLRRRLVHVNLSISNRHIAMLHTGTIRRHADACFCRINHAPARRVASQVYQQFITLRTVRSEKNVSVTAYGHPGLLDRSCRSRESTRMSTACHNARLCVSMSMSIVNDCLPAWLNSCLASPLPLPATTIHRCYSHCPFPVICTTYSTICTCFSLKTDLLRMSFRGISLPE